MDISTKLLQSLTTEYITKRRSCAAKARERFRGQSSINAAVSAAAQCLDLQGKRCPHQRRLRRVTLKDSEGRLLACSSSLRRCKSFDALLERIGQALAEVSGAGELYRYDLALRIGAYLRLRPEKVYLHAGTARGASLFGFAKRRRSIPPSSFPPPLNSLPAEEIEDLLCIYKADIAAGRRVAPKRKCNPTQCSCC